MLSRNPRRSLQYPYLSTISMLSRNLSCRETLIPVPGEQIEFHFPPYLACRETGLAKSRMPAPTTFHVTHIVAKCCAVKPRPSLPFHLTSIVAKHPHILYLLFIRPFHHIHVVAECRQSGGKSTNSARKFHFTRLDPH